jgi:hypothetical protein
MDPLKIILFSREGCKSLIDQAYDKDVNLGVQITIKLVHAIDGIKPMENITDITEMMEIFDIKADVFRKAMFHAN